MERFFVQVVLVSVLVLVGAATPVEAQAVRTWVSGVGDDANPCSRTAPCKTFAGAISKTAAGGEISILDPGNFGTVTITKSISIVAAGSEGGISAPAGFAGINVSAGPTGVVSLHGLFIEGAATGGDGIRVISARSVHVRNCLIRGFQVGIDAQGAGPSEIFVTDTTLTNNGRGIVVSPGSGEPIVAFLDRVQVTGNAAEGITADSDAAQVQLHNSTITDNGIGFSSLNHGTIMSFKTNVVFGNTVNGTPTTSFGLK